MSDNVFELSVGDVCEIFREYEVGESLLCRVLDVSGTHIVVERKETDAEKSGVSIFALESIWRVRFGAKDVGVVFSVDNSDYVVKAPEGEMNAECLLDLNKKFGYVTLHFEDRDTDTLLIGQIERVTDEVLFLNEYRPLNRKGRCIGAVRLDDITRIEAGGEYEQRLVRFYSN